MQIEALRRVSLQQPFKLGACSPAASKNQVAALEQRSHADDLGIYSGAIDEGKRTKQKLLISIGRILKP
jgi:hypothetical protein